MAAAGKKSTRSSRLEARITADQKALIERAASYAGQSVTDFVVGALSAAAQAVIQEQEIIRLNRAESEAFVAALLKPAPPPSAALKRAWKKYRRTVISR